MTTDKNGAKHQGKGVPTGGQFTGTTKSEAPSTTSLPPARWFHTREQFDKKFQPLNRVFLRSELRGIDESRIFTLHDGPHQSVLALAGIRDEAIDEILTPREEYLIAEVPWETGGEEVLYTDYIYPCADCGRDMKPGQTRICDACQVRAERVAAEAERGVIEPLYTVEQRHTDLASYGVSKVTSEVFWAKHEAIENLATAPAPEGLTGDALAGYLSAGRELQSITKLVIDNGDLLEAVRGATEEATACRNYGRSDIQSEEYFEARTARIESFAKEADRIIDSYNTPGGKAWGKKA